MVERAVLDRLIREQGIERYTLTLTSGEGTFMPDGHEEISGFVIDEQRQVVFSFWMEWDAKLQRPIFEEWSCTGLEPWAVREA